MRQTSETCGFRIPSPLPLPHTRSNFILSNTVREHQLIMAYSVNGDKAPHILDLDAGLKTMVIF